MMYVIYNKDHIQSFNKCI